MRFWCMRRKLVCLFVCLFVRLFVGWFVGCLVRNGVSEIVDLGLQGVLAVLVVPANAERKGG